MFKRFFFEGLSKDGSLLSGRKRPDDNLYMSTDTSSSFIIPSLKCKGAFFDNFDEKVCILFEIDETIE
jgi:hypothetical protein